MGVVSKAERVNIFKLVAGMFNAAPGTDNQGLAALVAREIERIENRRASQRRSQFKDPD